MRAIFDTNILVDYLKGVTAAKDELKRYRDIHISLITWMEILIGAHGETEVQKIKQFLTRFNVLPIDISTAEAAIAIRQKYRIKLPDALIWAGAEVNQCLLVTRNSKDFPADHPSIRIPYTP